MMESTVTRAFGVRKAILRLKVSLDCQVVATRGDTFWIICDYMLYNTALPVRGARWYAFARFFLTVNVLL